MDEYLSLNKIAEYLQLDLPTVRWLAHSQGWSYIERPCAGGIERKYIVASLRREVQLQIAEGYSKTIQTWV